MCWLLVCWFVDVGANLGLSLTINLEQYEDLAGDVDEAGVVVCIIIY